MALTLLWWAPVPAGAGIDLPRGFLDADPCRRLHWSSLPHVRPPIARVRVSRLPPERRWMEAIAAAANHTQAIALDRLERWGFGHPVLLHWSTRRHERAFRRLLPALSGRPLRRIAVVGGGLHPRTALILGRLLPDSRLSIVDLSASHLELARAYLEANGAAATVDFVVAQWTPQSAVGFDLVVLPLGYRGDRAALYRDAPAVPHLVHDWIWRRRGADSAVVFFFCKRLNLVA